MAVSALPFWDLDSPILPSTVPPAHCDILDHHPHNILDGNLVNCRLPCLQLVSSRRRASGFLFGTKQGNLT